MALKEQIEQMFGQDPKSLDKTVALRVFNELKFFLNGGEVRAAQRSTESECGWIVHEWVKKGILLGFRLGELTEFSGSSPFSFFDKDTYPLKRLTLDHSVRLVPGGSSIRDGCYVARGVVIMPPAYINAGSYIDEGTMVDSHALIGSCAQIGKRVHVSAGAQIGGVLEPISGLPVIIGDDVFIGGQCGIYEGTVVERRAVLAAGVLLTGSSKVYDVPRKVIHQRTERCPLVVPEGAVVVQGVRKLNQAFAKKEGLSISTPLIIKYRDEKTDAATALEEGLR